MPTPRSRLHASRGSGRVTPGTPARRARQLSRRWPVAAALLAGALAAPSAGAEAQLLRFSTLTVDDGLPQSSVLAIVQDRRGFVWLGTQEGLARYDGYRFRTWLGGPAPGSLADDEVMALALDSADGLWVGTSAGLNHFDTETERVTLIAPGRRPHESVDAVVVDLSDRVWFAPSEGGLWVVEGGGAPGEREVRRIQHARLPPDVTVTALAAGASVWAASAGHLLSATPEGSEPVRVWLSDLGAVSALAVATDGGVWIGRGDGAALLRFDPVSGQVREYPQVPTPVLSLRPQGDDVVWVGARAGGLSRLEVASGQVVTRRHDPGNPTGLSEDDVAALYLDRSGGLWIGTWNGGVSKLDPYGQALRTLAHRPHVRDSVIPDVIAMTEEADGRLWVASRSARLAAGDPETGRFRVLEWTAPGRVTALGRSGTHLYVASDRGLASLDAATGHPESLPPAFGQVSLDTSPIDALTVAPDGALWLASGSSLFEAREDRERGVGVHEQALPFGTPVSALFATPGRLWIASRAGGLASLDPAAGGQAAARVIEMEELELLAARHAWVTALFARDDVLWVGTRVGVARVDLNSRTGDWLDRRDGMPSATVTGLLGEHAGRVWVATNRGLTRIDASGDMLHFGSREGAEGSGYAEGAYTQGPSGRFYFAGNAITMFDPASVAIDPGAPTVVLTDLEVSHVRVGPRWLDPESPLATGIHAAEEVTLAPDDDVLGVEFAGLHFGEPRSHLYRYRLEGFDEEWVDTDARRRVATYTDLPPGEYTLRVRAATKHGAWSPEEATLSIRVLPHWWQTSWALWGGGVLALALIGGAFQLRVWALERDRLRLGGLVEARTAELEVSNRQRRQAEVSAALQSIVAGTAHEVRNPLFAISATVDTLCLLYPNPDQARLRDALQTEVRRLSVLTDRLLEYGTPQRPRLEALRVEQVVAEAWEGCHREAARRGVDMVPRFDPGLPGVEGDRLSLVRSFAKLLDNAIEHSPGGSAVVVTGSREAAQVVVRVEDSGPGIPPEDLPRVFDLFFTRRVGASGLGLSLAQRFVESHGGHLSAENRDEGGTRFTVRLPLTRP